MTSDKAYALEARLNAVTPQTVSPRSQSFSSTAANPVTGLSRAVLSGGQYTARARLIIEWNSTAGTPQMAFAGPSVSQFDVSFKSQQSATPNVPNNANTVSAGTGAGTGYLTGGGGSLIGVTVAQSVAGVFFDMDIWGIFTFTANGTLTLQAATSVLTDAWTVLSGFWQVW